MRYVSKDILKIACSSMSYTLFTFLWAYVFYVLLTPFIFIVQVEYHIFALVM